MIMMSRTMKNEQRHRRNRNASSWEWTGRTGGRAWVDEGMNRQMGDIYEWYNCAHSKTAMVIGR